MSLIVEDGTGVAGAISYASVEDARAYAAERGLVLPVDDAAVEVLLVRACDYLESLESQYKGVRTTPGTQALAWPRSLVFLFGNATSIDDALIPTRLRQAQCQAAFDLQTADPQATGTGREVLSETIGPLSTTYAKRGTAAVRPVLTKVLDMLQPLMRQTGPLSTIRV
jgi:hypothetical protein